jgi:DNA-binding NtrC family response regulator
VERQTNGGQPPSPRGATLPARHSKRQILIASSNPKDVLVLKAVYGEEFVCRTVEDRETFRQELGRSHPDLAFIDVQLLHNGTPSLSQDAYRQLMRTFWEASSSGPIIILAPPALLREAVKAVKAGASNYLSSPIDPAEVGYVTESLQEFERFRLELDYLRDHYWYDDSLELVRTESPLMREALTKIKLVAPTRTTVLLTGETGVGKSTMAKLIHRHSDRSTQQFISVHCGAIPETLLESELFGHERGAFTGAVRRKLGKFEIASGGTIFLDEIGLLTPAAQIKLLSVIQERVMQRVGGERDIPVDVRIIAASNDDLKVLCDQGAFRSDLYFRLSVFPIDIPPLRVRKEDLPHLTQVFLRQLRQSQQKQIEEIDPRVLEAFGRYSWPGNVRELENLVERAYILEESEALTPGSFPAELFAFQGGVQGQAPDTHLSLSEFRQQHLEQLERQYLVSLLREHGGKLHETARAAGIGVRQLHKLLTKYGLRGGQQPAPADSQSLPRPVVRG